MNTAKHTPGSDTGLRDVARAVGRESAWQDLMRRFTQQQRRHLANLLAHKWTIEAIEIRGHHTESVERIEAEKSHADAVAELTAGRPDEAQVKREWAMYRKANAHDDLLGALREAELFIRTLGLDSAPAASLAADMRAVIAKATESQAWNS